MTTEPPRQRQDRLVGMLLAHKYKIIQKIGEGGMGSVYIASDETLDRKVAIKVLLGKLAEDEIAVRRFEQEAKAISKMQHPNTVTIYEFGEIPESESEGKRLYIAMEYLRGRTLTQLLRAETVLSPVRAARILRQVCASLAEAHALGIIHRDLKPDNIFLTEVGSDRDWVKVLDFGVAKLANAESAGTLTQTGMIFGTPKYMSPEQAEGRPIDHRADIYALGVVLYEILVGRPPFLSETPVGLLLKHISEPPSPFKKVRPDLTVPPLLESIALKALSKQPSERHQAVSELAADLERFERAQTGTYPMPVIDAARVTIDGPGLPTELMAGAAGVAATPVPPSAVPSNLSLGAIAPSPSPARRGSTTLAEDGLATAHADVALRPRSGVTPSSVTDDLLGDHSAPAGAVTEASDERSRPRRGLLIGGALALCAAIGLAVFALRVRTSRIEALPMANEAAANAASRGERDPTQGRGSAPSDGESPPSAPSVAPTALGVGEAERTSEHEQEPEAEHNPPGPQPQLTPGIKRGTPKRSRAENSEAKDARLVQFSMGSTPSGALVTLDGQEIGRTPFVRWFPRDSGTLKFVVSKEGFGEKIITRSTSKNQDVDVRLTRSAEAQEEHGHVRAPADVKAACPDGSAPPCKTSRDPLREKVGDLK